MLTDDRMLNLAKLMDVAMLRSRVAAGNIANQSTPGYKARQVEFDAEFLAAMNRGDAAAARSVMPKVIESTDLVGNDENNVDLDREVTLAAESAMMYRTYASVLRGKAGLISTAIGRGA